MGRVVLWFAIAFAFAGGVACQLVLPVWLASRPAATKVVVYSPGAHPTSPWRGSSVPEVLPPDESPHLPPVKRDVPVFEGRLLDGCSHADLDAVETGISDAIDVGAPLYNAGDFDGCYRTYESAALTLERKTSAQCKGPAKALRTGRENAAKLSTPAQQAWAMRDAFDGLLDVIGRKGPEL
jgi:hypothetical protein